MSPTPVHLLRALLVLLSLVQLILPTPALASATSFYVVGHPDDWQLFMGNSAYTAIRDANSKVVFIYLTAGDAAEGFNTGFAVAREDASHESTRFAADSISVKTMPVTGTRVFNGHTLHYWQYKNTVSYYFRLPDGFPDGSQPASMQRLYNNKIYILSAIDGSATYSGWYDLPSTLASLITSESTGGGGIWIHAAETNTQLNPKDHSDHVYASVAVQMATSTLTHCSRVLWAEYDTGQRTPNLSTWETLNKAGLLSVYSQKMNQRGYTSHNSWTDDHRRYLDKSYFRTRACGAPLFYPH